MTKTAADFSLLNGFTYADEAGVSQKIRRFIQAGADELHFVFDFDRTLTVNQHETQEDVTTWRILGHHLPPIGQQEDQTLYKKYRSLEINDKLTEYDAIEWWTSILKLYQHYRVDMIKVEEDFLSRASIRPQATELFAVCEQRGIPTVVLSAGIRNVIEIWSRAYNVTPTLILSTALTLDKEGRIAGWLEDTLVHTLNKHEAGHAELTNIRSGRPKTIVVGDSMSDADMVSGEKDVLRIRIFDPRADESMSMSWVRQKTFEKFDVMIESGNFWPLFNLMKAISGEA